MLSFAAKFSYLLKFQIPNFRFQIHRANLEFGIWNLELKIRLLVRIKFIPKKDRWQEWAKFLRDNIKKSFLLKKIRLY
jgi:hypothetical protein